MWHILEGLNPERPIKRKVKAGQGAQLKSQWRSTRRTAFHRARLAIGSKFKYDLRLSHTHTRAIILVREGDGVPVVVVQGVAYKRV